MSAPSKYSTLIADLICDEIASGRSLKDVCLDDGMPHFVTVFRWLDKNEEFRGKYKRATEIRTEYLAEEVIALSDRPVKAEKRVIKADGGEEVTIGDNTERTRLQIDARKWYAAKVYPKKYGEKVQQEVSGPNGAPLPAITVQLVKPSADQS
jgi:hypothetical protein